MEWPDGFANDRRYPRGVRNFELVPGMAHDAASDEEFFARPVIKILARVPETPAALSSLDDEQLADALCRPRGSPRRTAVAPGVTIA